MLVVCISDACVALANGANFFGDRTVRVNRTVRRVGLELFTWSSILGAPQLSTLPSMSGKNIVFFHPDLGIGGAERLIIDAAVGLQTRGHQVTIFTSHRDPRHCFDEARDGPSMLRLRR